MKALNSMKVVLGLFYTMLFVLLAATLTGCGGGSSGSSQEKPVTSFGVLSIVFPQAQADASIPRPIITVSIKGSGYSKTQVLSDGSVDTYFKDLPYGTYELSASASMSGVESGSYVKTIQVNAPNVTESITLKFNTSMVSTSINVITNYASLNSTYYGSSKFHACGFTLPRLSNNSVTSVKVTGNNVEITVTGTNEPDVTLVGSITSDNGLFNAEGIYQTADGDVGEFKIVKASQMAQFAIYLDIEMTGDCEQHLSIVGQSNI